LIYLKDWDYYKITNVKLNQKREKEKSKPEHHLNYACFDVYINRERRENDNEDDEKEKIEDKTSILEVYV
jgi:hypothetical protein